MGQEKKIFLTKEGLAELKEELEYLRFSKRPEVVESLKEAKALGDLSENAEYDSARSEQAEVEAKIKELEFILDNYELVGNGDGKKVSIGEKVKILYIEDNEEDIYTIVGSTEADPFENKISNESELAKAIMGKKVGDTVSVCSEDGKYPIKILQIIK